MSNTETEMPVAKPSKIEIDIHKLEKTFGEKLLFSIITTILFALVSFPWTALYPTGCMTDATHLAATIIFAILLSIVYLLLNCYVSHYKTKMTTHLKYAFLMACVYFLVTSNTMYKLVAGSLGEEFGRTDAEGNFCPTFYGVAIHGLIFFFIKFLLMHV